MTYVDLDNEMLGNNDLCSTISNQICRILKLQNMLHWKMTSNNYVQMRIFSVGKSFLYSIYYERKQLNRNDLLVVLEFFGIKQKCNLSQSCKGLFIQPNDFEEFKCLFCTKIAVDFLQILFTLLLLVIRQYKFLPVNLKLFYNDALYF